MLISIEELKEIYSDKDFSRFSDKRIELKLESIEMAIRKYCNNNFQNRNIRYKCIVKDNKVIFISKINLKVSDTVQISYSKFNNGLYVVKEINEDKSYFVLDKPLKDEDILITKVEYPIDIIDGAVEILNWDFNKSDKVGISSESISRHSVSYQTYDGNNTVYGYPSRLFGFCKHYVKGRT